MVVTRSNFSKVLDGLLKLGADCFGLDTETFGVGREDRLFSIAIDHPSGGYYFNFLPYPGLDSEYVLPYELIEEMQPFFDNPESLFFIHNAKFDLGKLAKEGLCILGAVHCTEAMERVFFNAYMGSKPYSLASCAQRRGHAKDDSVEQYISKHRLYENVSIPGKGKLFKKKHFDKVPFEIMTKYAGHDALLHRVIGEDQLQRFKAIDDCTDPDVPRIMGVVQNERKFTKSCFRMEQKGIHFDRPFTERALKHTASEILALQGQFKEMTGLVFEDKATVIKEAFLAAQIELPKTRTGKPCTNKKVLDGLKNPVADKIREIRERTKLISTYYSSFLHFADENDIIHANMRQGGTETSRLSYSDPNLQNIPKEDEPEDQHKEFLVRRCFTPLNDNWVLAPIDFKQQEFRLMLDYAGEKELIDSIMGGMDVHDATAQLLGITRKQAKTINFGLLYGMGAAKLAAALGVELREAHRLRSLYFEKLPKVQKFIRRVMSTGEKRGYVRNWFGFRNNITSPEYAYVLPNHLIQGGCGQVIRIATNLLDEHIRKHRLRSWMAAQVHDEILFHVHKSELDEIPKFQKIMETVYKPKNGLVLECSAEHSWKSWAKWDLHKGFPTATI